MTKLTAQKWCHVFTVFVIMQHPSTETNLRLRWFIYLTSEKEEREAWHRIDLFFRQTILQKRTTKFHWKNLYVLLLKYTSLPPPPHRPRSAGRLWSSARSGKGYWRRCSFPSYFRYIWHFIPKPNVGNFKGKLIFIFILLANRPTGNNTHKTRIYAVQKQAKMIIMDHSCIGLVLLQCMWNSQSILIPANPNLFLPYIFYFYNNMITYIVSKKV